MHLLLVHQFFIPPDEPGGTRHYELTTACVQAGHRITVVTSNVNYQTGKRYTGHGALWSEYNLGGIIVRRVKAVSSLHSRFLLRLISFFSFTLLSVLCALKVRQVDLVMGTSPSLFQGFSAWISARLKRKPFLLEIRDLWPEFAIDIGILKNPFLIYFSRKLEKFLYRRADHILVNSPAYKIYIHDKGIPSEKITLIANGVLPEFFYPGEKNLDLGSQLGLDDKFVIAYAGALGLANDIGTIIRAASLCQSDPDIQFLIIGGGNKKVELQQMATSMNLKNVIFTGPISKDQMPAYLSLSDVCVATLQNIPMFRTTYPNKVFDYMAAGRPTILAIDGVIRQVIEASEGGLFVEPGNPEALAKAVFQLKKNPQLCISMGEAARSYVVSHFNRHDQAAEFVRLVDKMEKVGQ